MSLNYVTITGTFQDATGNPLTGVASFVPNVTVYAAGLPVLEADVPITAEVVAGALRASSGGAFQLLATDNAGLTYLGQTSFIFYTVTLTLAGQVLDPWSFFLPHSPSTVDLFSLANTAAGGFVSPMTTLGDTLYGGAGGAATRLPGDTSNIRKFLREQSAAGVATAPVWDSLQAGDIPQLPDYAPTGLTGATAATRYVGGTASGAPASGTFAVGDFVIDQAGKVWICTTAGTPGTWTQAGTTIPLTTLGDTLYEGSSGLARLPGNTTAAKQFLTQAGTGSVSAAPAWGGIQPADLPAATTSVQGAVILDGTVTDIQPSPGTQAAGAVGKPSDAGHVHPQPPVLAPTGLTGAIQASRYAGATVSGPPVTGTFAKADWVLDQSGLIWACRTAGTPGTWGQAGDQPWQFRPESYGAKGDGRIINDATIASGQLSTLTSATAAFTSADTGKTIMLNGGQGNNAQPLITTITYVSATTVTLGHAASGAVTNASAVYGTDDTAAIQAAITAAGNYAMAAGGPFRAQVLFSARIYCLATLPPVTLGNSSSTTCQLQIPRPATSGATQKLIIEFLGAGCADANMYFDATVPNVQGTALVSMCIPPYVNGTNPYPSVLGFQYAADGSLTGGFANTKAFVDGLTVVIPYLGPQGACDFRFLGGAGGGRVSAFAFGAPSLGAYNNLNNLNNLAGQQNGSSVGMFCPLTGNNDDCTFTSFTVQGFTFGLNITEHCSFQRVASVYNVVGIQCVGGGAHIGASIGYASVEQVFAALQYTGTSPFTVSMVLDCEQVTGWHVQDTQQALYGKILVHTNTGAPAVLGASNTEVIWDAQPRAVQSAPAYTLGTAFQNPWWHPATITLAGGTVTGISVGPASGSLTSLGITSGTFRLPSGWWLSIAGSVKPTTFIAVLD